MSVGHSL